MAPVFVHGTTGFAFVAMYCRGEKKLDCFKRKAPKGRFLLLFVWAYFLFAASMRPTKTL